MFQELQFSSLILCYGPLALIILGFIAFAWRTDWLARKTYLRNLDPRADDERGQLPTKQVEEPVQAATPAGYTVTILPPESE